MSCGILLILQWTRSKQNLVKIYFSEIGAVALWLCFLVVTKDSYSSSTLTYVSNFLWCMVFIRV